MAEIYRNYWLTPYFKLELPAPLDGTEWSLSRCIMGNLGSDVSRAWLILEITIQGVLGIFLVSSQTLSILNGWNAPLVILPVLKIFNHFSNTDCIQQRKNSFSVNVSVFHSVQIFDCLWKPCFGNQALAFFRVHMGQHDVIVDVINIVVKLVYSNLCLLSNNNVCWIM